MSDVFVSWLDAGELPTPTPMCWPQAGEDWPIAEAVLAILFWAAASDGVSKPAEGALLQELTRRWSVRKVLREKT